jgi:hypothetical protein
MSLLSFGFHYLYKEFKIEKTLFEKFSVNTMRSIICGIIANEAYTNCKYLWIDKCLNNEFLNKKFIDYHNMFMSYFIFDTIILVYQVYLNIEKTIRIDLLFHHFLAITVLILIEEKKLFGISLMIGLSEGMSFVTGPKLISMYYGYKNLTNFFITFRLLYLIFVRMLLIWPSIIIYYYLITYSCEKYKNNNNLLSLILMIIIIIHLEINWLHNGRKELARI